jgi:hypothetical protein
MAFLETNGPRIRKKKLKFASASNISIIISVSISIIALIISGFFALQSNDISQTNLQLQNVTSNYPAYLSINVQSVSMGPPSELYLEDFVVYHTTHYGTLNITFSELAPHFCKLSVNLTDFIPSSSEYINSLRINQTSVRFFSQSDKGFEPIYPAGLNNAEISFLLEANVYPNTLEIPYLQRDVYTQIGVLKGQVNLVDMQHNEQIIVTKDFSTNVIVVFNSELYSTPIG